MDIEPQDLEADAYGHKWPGQGFAGNCVNCGLSSEKFTLQKNHEHCGDIQEDEYGHIWDGGWVESDTPHPGFGTMGGYEGQCNKCGMWETRIHQSNVWQENQMIEKPDEECFIEDCRNTATLEGWVKCWRGMGIARVGFCEEHASHPQLVDNLRKTNPSDIAGYLNER
jgi:hypothetical protein